MSLDETSTAASRTAASRTPDQDARGGEGLLADAVLVFLLWGLAVAQPLYGVLAEGAEFFVARRSPPGDVVLLSVALSFLLPAALAVAAALLGLWHRGAGAALHRAWLCALSAIVLMSVLKRLPGLPAAAVLIAAGLGGVAYGWGLACWRLPRRRIFWMPAAALAVSLPLWFLCATPVRKVVLPQGSLPQSSGAAVASRAWAELTTPVFLVVLDELPTTTLMDREGGIDGSLFPGFDTLASGSTWYRNATTVADFTHRAVPAILTGRYPAEKLLPTARDHPDNLFTLVGARDRLDVVEWVTELCPRALCEPAEDAPSVAARWRSLSLDLLILYGHVVLPTELAGRQLPPVTQGWSGFASPAHGDVDGGRSGDGPRSAGRGDRVAARGDRVASFERFIGSIRRRQRPTLHFYHARLPHHPWQFMPSGKRYGFNTFRRTRAFYGERWSTDPWSSIQGFQRHLLQTMLTDRLVSKMLERMHEEDLYDRSLLIVTADHGLSFRPGDQRRQLTAQNYRDVMSVPLFVKWPRQRQGEIDDRNVELVDVVPTIARAQGMDVPWEVDGRPLSGGPDAPRGEKVLYSEAGERWSFDAGFERDDVLAWRSKLLGRGRDPARVYGISPDGRYRAVVGRPSATLRRLEEEWEGVLRSPGVFEKVSPKAATTPAWIAGRVYGAPEAPLDLAVAVNGIIRAVTRTEGEGKPGRFSAVVPESAFEAGRNRVDVFVIRTGAGGTPGLSPVRLGESPYDLDRAGEPDREVIRSAEGKTFQVVRGKIRGKVRRALARELVVLLRGWVEDRESPAAPEAILVFEDGELRFSGTAHRRRRGARARGWHFAFTVPRETFSDLESSHVRVFAISNRGYASELRYWEGYPWGPRQPVLLTGD